jgi:hypothetical protein
LSASANGDGSTPSVTIYVASINTASATELCVRSIFRHTSRGAYNLCIGDCGSTDNSLPRIMELVHEHLVDDVMLAPRGRSHGAWLDLWTTTCTTRYAAMVDSDVEILKSDWLDVLLKTAHDFDAAIVCAEIIEEVPRYVDYTGVARRLARRPSAWMMLVDVAKCRDRASWQFSIEDDSTIPEQQWAFDTGAQLMRALALAGERVVVAPTIQPYFRHYGGLSWVKMTPPRGWRHRAHRLKVGLLNLYLFGRLKRMKVPKARRPA